MQIANAKQVIDRMVVFLNKHVAISNGHMVDFFTKNLFNLYIPEEIQIEINEVGYEETVASIINNRLHPLMPNLNDFIATAKSFSLYNQSMCMNLLDFKSKLSDLSKQNVVGLHMDVFMKSKKAHEVEIMSAIADMMLKITDSSHLIDIGDGKGYLSSLLAFNHKIPVLGVDASLNNTTNAIKRANLLEKHWVSITKQPKENMTNLYKQVTQFVTEQTDFDQLITNVFLEKNTGLGLVGLHTCGNLGPASIRIFNSNRNIKSICNVSCCYHLLSENFVMSEYLKGFELSRVARMLSAQSIDRILHRQDLPSKNIFYRAIVQIIVEKFTQKTPERNVGKFRKEPENFVEYSREALKRLRVDFTLPDDDLQRFYFDYENERVKLNVFNLIRSMLAPAIEALILLDRYLFLLEQGHENVFLVQLFDPVISPRCYGLVAFK